MDHETYDTNNVLLLHRAPPELATPRLKNSVGTMPFFVVMLTGTRTQYSLNYMHSSFLDKLLMTSDEIRKARNPIL